MVGLALGCGGDVPTATQAYDLNLSAAGESGCFTVKFTSQSVGSFPVFEGTHWGDIGGTHVVTFEFPPTTAPHGVTWNFLGTAEWTIESEYPALDGLVVTTTLESRNVFNDDEVFANISNLKTRALDGVKKANLTGRGETSLDMSTVNAWWNGVICP